MRLIASDIDGTILGHDGQIRPRTVRAFAQAREAGVEIVFVTGRPPRWLTPLREQLGHQGTVICSNGAVVYSMAEEKVLSASLLRREDVLAARELILELEPSARFAAETLEGFHLEPGFLEPASVALQAITPAPLEESLGEQGDGQGIVKFLAITHHGSADSFLARTRPVLGGMSVTHSAPSQALLEMGPKGVNKAVTLEQYAQSLGIQAADVVAFGDMPNDVEMLQWAGGGYAMASGHTAALEAANERAPHFEDDGVAQVIEALLAQRVAGAEIRPR